MAGNFCYCEGPNAARRHRWELAWDDRYCGLCGRATRIVRPRDLEATIDGRPGIVCYLSGSEGGSATGSFGLLVPGDTVSEVEIRWLPDPGSALELRDWWSPRPGEVEATLFHKGPGEGLTSLGSGRLVLLGPGIDQTISVAAYRVDQARWRMVARGSALDRVSGVVTIGPDLAPFWVEVIIDYGPGIPVRWDEVASDHPAVQAQPVDPSRATSPASIRLRWEPARWESGFGPRVLRVRLSPRGLPPFRFELTAERLAPSPIHAEPAALILGELRGDRPSLGFLTLTNTDPTKSFRVTIRADVDWLSPVDGEPIRIEPGGSTVTRVAIDPKRLLATPGPFLGRILLTVDRGKAPQEVPVRVGSIERPAEPATLLVVPGSSRIVIALMTPDFGVRFTRRGGDLGIESEALGLTVESQIPQVVEAARRFALDAERWRAGAVVVIGSPRLGSLASIEGTTLLDWEKVARYRFAGEADLVARVDPWSVALIPIEPGSDPIAVRPEAAAHLLGPCLANWLGDQIRPRIKGTGGANPAPWLLLAAERFAESYGREPGLAWRRLGACWRSNIPEARYSEPDTVDGDRRLRLALRSLLIEIGSAPRPSTVPLDRPLRIVVLNGLFRGGPIRALLDSIVGVIPVDFRTQEPDWADWTAKFLAHRDEDSSSGPVGP